PVVPQPPAYHPGSAAVPTPGGQPDHPDGSAYPASTPPFGGAAGSPAGGVGVPYQSSHPVDPMSGPPLSGAPMLGVPYGSPMAAPSRKPPTVLVLAIVAGLLLVFSGVMTTLFLIKSSELNDTRRTLTAQVAERDATIET